MSNKIMKTITIEVDEENDVVYTLEEVLKQVKLGNTSGIYPNWDIISD